uniref:Uncharacterized protein n=1 Tax=Anguilla anguilla TaxID=7936 RepID=A0A0E9QHF0_ANGAN
MTAVFHKNAEFGTLTGEKG